MYLPPPVIAPPDEYGALMLVVHRGAVRTLCGPGRSDSIDKLVSNLQVTDEERRKLVNTRIEPALMGSVLDFLYKEKHLDSVPPMLQLTPVNPLQPVRGSGGGGG